MKKKFRCSKCVWTGEYEYIEEARREHWEEHMIADHVCEGTITEEKPDEKL